MTTEDIHLLFLLGGFGVALYLTWNKAFEQGYDTGYFAACDDVAHERIRVVKGEPTDD